jgi:hypothetical protein
MKKLEIKWNGKRAAAVLLREAADRIEDGLDGPKDYGRDSAAFLATIAFDATRLTTEARFRNLLRKEVHWPSVRIDVAIEKVKSGRGDGPTRRRGE